MNNGLIRVIDYLKPYKEIVWIIVTLIVVLLLFYQGQTQEFFKYYINQLTSGKYPAYSLTNPTVYTVYFETLIVSGSALLGLIPIFLVEVIKSVRRPEQKQKINTAVLAFGILLTVAFVLVFLSVIQSISGFFAYSQFYSYYSSNTTNFQISNLNGTASCSDKFPIPMGNFSNDPCQIMITDTSRIFTFITNSFYNLYLAMAMLVITITSFIIVIAFEKFDEKSGKNETVMHMESTSNYGARLYERLIKHLEGKTVYNGSFPLNTVFWASLECFAEATRNYDENLHESTAIMCRNTLDSAIFEALIKRPSGSNYAEWDLQQIDGFRKDYFAEFLKEPDEKKKVLILNEAIKKIREIEWPTLKKNAINQKLFNEKESNGICAIREMGDYSSHRATSIIKDLFKASREKRSIKIRTFATEAKDMLDATENWLEKLIDRYYKKSIYRKTRYRDIT